jgi:hypothetical protein
VESGEIEDRDGEGGEVEGGGRLGLESIPVVREEEN